MSTRPKDPVGTSVATPMATAPSAVPVVQTAPAPVPVAGGGTPAIDHSHGAILAAGKRFREGLLLLVADFRPYLRALPAGTTSRKGAVNSRREAATPLLTAILRDEPDLAPRQDADAIDAAMLAGQGYRQIAQDLQALLVEVEDTSRQEVSDAWTGASAIYAAATHEAKTQAAMATKLVRVHAVMAHGARKDTSVVTTARAEDAANRAATRAVKARGKADSATRSRARLTQAHADTHPAENATPPVENPQGPAASAGVNPQGPAPGK